MAISSCLPRAPTTKQAPPRPASSFDEDDAITPCPPSEKEDDIRAQQQNHERQQQEQQHPHYRYSSHHDPQHLPRPSTSSWRDHTPHFEPLDDDEEVDILLLWRRMLAIQRVFGCYNSARMDAALAMDEEDSSFIPSKTCLDLLNDSIDRLPEETRRQVEEFVEREICDAKRARQRKQHRTSAWKSRTHAC